MWKYNVNKCLDNVELLRSLVVVLDIFVINWNSFIKKPMHVSCAMYNVYSMNLNNISQDKR